MTRVIGLVLLLTVVATSGWAAVFTVTNKADSGPGSLRDAINQANANGVLDTITFAPKLTTKVIAPLTQLPTLTEAGTTIDGDLDNDCRPDIALNGQNVFKGNGLVVGAGGACTIDGLSITSFSAYGIELNTSHDNVIKCCYLGITRKGTTVQANGQADIYVSYSDRNRIGGPAAADRNLFATGAGTRGIEFYEADGNTAQGNYFGLKPDGSPLPSVRHRGIVLDQSSGNAIGGDQPGEGNVFGNLEQALMIAYSSSDNTVAGNYIGIGPDGSTSLPITVRGISVNDTSTYNIIGGTTPGARNVFAGGAPYAIGFFDSDTVGNKVKGNYFGTNAAGTGKRPLEVGVQLFADAAAQQIGGKKPKAGNYFCCSTGTTPTGISFANGGNDTLVRYNKFGIRPSGSAAAGMGAGVYAQNVHVRVFDNTFLGMSHAGLKCYSPGTYAYAFGNIFGGCNYGVYVGDSARCLLGNLGNADTSDDGGNSFGSSNTWHIYNSTPTKINAEGNSFGTTSKSAINAKVYDKKDNPAVGKIDFDPLDGGVSPTGRGTVGVAGLSALPTAAGAEIVFTLSSPAGVTITVLNLAGRPVAMLTSNAQMGPGVQRLAWSGRANSGLAAPMGRYLVRINARGDEGEVAQALCTFCLTR